jgi:hypothetical protein
MPKIHYGLIAALLLVGTSVVAAQQEKTQQNSADEALTRSAPEAKDQPQAPAAARQNEASQPGTRATDEPFTDGKLTAAGAPEDSQVEPSKFNAKNYQLDNMPTMAIPLALTDEQKRTLLQQIGQSNAPVSDLAAKPAEAVPATLALQEFPKDIAASMPLISDYKFLRLKDRILVVNPRESIVVGEITQ